MSGQQEGKAKQVSSSESSHPRSAPAKDFACPHCHKRHPIFMTKCPDTGKPIDSVYKMEGQLLEGKYSIGRLVAEGGMGVVYEGKHLTIDRKIAIKFLTRDIHSNPDSLARFQNEAKVAASIGHRNIVDILDMGSTRQGLPYIVMEFLEGADLRDLLESSVRLPATLAVDLSIQILGALRAVHDRGVVHRDLKPDNVFVAKESGGGLMVKLLDFGVSRLQQDGVKNQNITKTGAVFGTPRYMAPEQARGAKDVDRRADIYSAGVMLYEMLTGSLPFQAESYNSLIIAITTEQPVNVLKHGVPIPDGLDEVVMRSISRTPETRYQDAYEFVQALLPYRSPVEGMDPSISLSTGIASVRSGTPRPGASLRAYTPASGTGRPSGRAATPSPPPGFSSSQPGSSVPRGGPGAPDSPTVKPGEYVSSPSFDLPPDPARPELETWKSQPGDPPRRRTPRGPLTPSKWEQSGSGSVPVPVTEVPPAQATVLRRRLGPTWVLVTVAVLVVCSAAAALAVMAIKTRQLESRMTALARVPAVRPDPAPIEVVKVRPWSVALGGIPDQAEVYVDDTLHPERPVLVQEAAGARRIRVVAPGMQEWVKEVAIHSDVELDISLEPEAPADLEPAKPQVKGTKKTHPADGGSEKEPPTKAKKKIDVEYPGLQ